MRISSFNEFELPGAIPFLHAAFANKGGLACFVGLIPNKSFDAMIAREACDDTLAVLPRALRQIVGHADV
jgi:hypothetical protein